jgi:hypothetical protein
MNELHWGGIEKECVFCAQSLSVVYWVVISYVAERYQETGQCFRMRTINWHYYY